MEMTGFSLSLVGQMIHKGQEEGNAVVHEVPAVLSLYVSYDIKDFLVGFLVPGSNLIFVREVEDGCPGIRHPDAEGGIQRDLTFSQDFPGEISNLSCGGSVGGYEIHIVSMGNLYLAEEFLDKGGQTPEMGGTYDANAFSLLQQGGELLPFHAVCYADSLLLKG